MKDQAVEQAVEKTAEQGKGLLGSIQGWFESINLEKWFGEASADAIQVAICFVSFFAVGFLFKKYLKIVFWALLLAIVFIKLGEHYEVIQADWQMFNKLIGLEPDATFTTVGQKAFEWVKGHIAVTVASFVGFLFGYKLG